MDSFTLYQKTNSLVCQCGTRDPEKIAGEIGITIYPMDSKNLLGMYTCRWNYRMIFVNPHMDHYLRKMVIAHEIGHDSEHRDIAKKVAKWTERIYAFQNKR